MRFCDAKAASQKRMETSVKVTSAIEHCSNLLDSLRSVPETSKETNLIEDCSKLLTSLQTILPKTSQEIRDVQQQSDTSASIPKHTAPAQLGETANPLTLQETKDVQPQSDASSSIPKHTVPAPLGGTLDPPTSPSTAPRFSPVMNQRLPTNLQRLVGDYQRASVFVLRELIEYGGANHKIDSQGHISFLETVDDKNVQHPMRVDLDLIKNDDGYYLAVPRIVARHYTLLLDSMFNRKSKFTSCQLREKLRAMAEKLDITIAGRSTVHEWYKCLPEADGRVNNNPQHAAFLARLEDLRDCMDSYL